VRGLHLALGLALRATPGSADFVRPAWDTVIRSRAVVLDELASRHRAVVAATDAETGKVAAEVASNFHQALVRGHLLRTMTDRGFQIAVLEEAMAKVVSDQEFLDWGKKRRIDIEPVPPVKYRQYVLQQYEIIEKFKDLFEKSDCYEPCGYPSSLEAHRWFPLR
jgi:hypothetical protein